MGRNARRGKVKVHYCRPGSVRTCSQQSYGFARTSDESLVTCERCLKHMAIRRARAQAVRPPLECNDFASDLYRKLFPVADTFGGTK